MGLHVHVLTHVQASTTFTACTGHYWSPTVELSCSDSDEPEIPEPVRATPARNETAVCGRCAPVNLVSFPSPEEPKEDCQPESTDVAVDELKLYFSLPDATLATDPLEWWPRHEKMLPALSRMARQLLGVPAPSTAVERLFSGVGQDFSKQRHVNQ